MSPQVWSAPEMPPPLDMNLGLGFSYLMSPEKTAFSVDSSPLHSPRVSPRRSTRSPTGPTSPLHKKLSLETTSAWRDGNGQANVHPLPLPPGATSPSQPTSISQITAKPDLMPINISMAKRKAYWPETGALCAMKEVELCFEDPKSAESIKQLEQEIKVLSQLKHPNIVQYYGSEVIDDRFYIYLEYVHPGSINKYIRDHCGAMTESVVRNFTRHILSGLAYLHSTKTIHRDIKGANLLVNASGVVKLADFGMAKHLSGPAANLSLKGSPYWMAPELERPLESMDQGWVAYGSDVKQITPIACGGCSHVQGFERVPPPYLNTLSSEGKDFLRCCFRRNPADRPTASKLLEHRFLNNSPQLDMPACTQALNGMKLMDKTESSREPPIYKLDHLLPSPDAQRGKLANNETGQRSYHETSELTAAPRHSPRSTLEALPSLSPPRSGHTTNIPRSINEGAKTS
ncbi:mitogen-activated protein kinase kinase kinase 5 [Actinidia rufa]|uniref:Mitogen-activated protein kinase kinase kinase 5 n=1 Tax=Actinidia rufa TaxID=165716 RepID=A0A7J0F688_9ERIC|nr:mitogen-activated protein kinase kinase kinase 5 [Actinidia rufa]